MQRFVSQGPGDHPAEEPEAPQPLLRHRKGLPKKPVITSWPQNWIMFRARLIPMTGAVGGFGLATYYADKQQHTSLHCMVPCGIFNDPARMTKLQEDATTIRKAMVQLNATPTSNMTLQQYNQGTRWIMTKETHADAIIT